jgi:exopolysaccharide biosynthesis polyprenyl glycosylphosphotransferase
MLRQFSAKRIVGFFLIDWLGTLAVLLLAAFLRGEMGNLPQPLIDLAGTLEITLGGTAAGDPSSTILSLSPRVFVFVAFFWPILFIASSVYDARNTGTLQAELRSVFLAICASTLILAGALYFTYRETSRVLILIFFCLDVALLLGSRGAWWAYRHSGNGQRATRSRAVLIVGAGTVGFNAAEQLKRYDWADVQLIGYVDDDPDKQGQQFEGVPVLGTLDQVDAIVQAHGVKDAVVALPLRAHEQLLEICRKLQGLSVRVHVIPDLFVLSFPSATLDGFGGIPVIDLGLPGIQGWQRLSKQAFDVAVALAILLLLSPLLAVLAVLIRLDSPGPVLFKQPRVGENGQLFEIVKFRSMRIDADANVHKAHVQTLIRQNLSLDEASGQNSLKMEKDPRVTRVGRFIRKFSLDELPQLINVLRGQMSLVGPRPHLPYEVELYQDWHRRRFEALPGITGWWQVKGRNRVSFDEMVRMDIYYVEHQSFWLDLKILLMTPWTVLSARGAG